LYKDATFDNFKTDIYSKVESKQLAVMAKNDSIRFVSNIDKMEQAGMGLYIYSDAKGSGKSRLASTISNELIEVGVRNKYTSASTILSEIQRTWNDKNESESKIIDNYVSPRVLIVDDLGARSGQAWMDEKFFMIIDSRYQNNKITIFTSNYAIGSLPFKDNRIIDRLSDVDRFHVLKMPNETLRPKSRVTGNGDDLFISLTRKER
jgi:DNA replication protein DnaC